MLKNVEIDTMQVVCKLTDEEKEELANLIDFNKISNENIKVYRNGNKAFNRIIYSNAPFFMIYYEPRQGHNLWLSKHYNIMILMQKEVINNPPALIKAIMSIGKWKVKRQDIAYDWLVPMDKHFMWVKSNVKKTVFKDNQNYYIYSNRSTVKALVYDKKEQLRIKKNQLIPEKHLTRLEIRIKPKLTDEENTISNYEWVKKYLDKFDFVINPAKISHKLKKFEHKKAFRALRRNQKMNWAEYGGETVKRKIRTVVKQNREDLYRLFEDRGINNDSNELKALLR